MEKVRKNARVQKVGRVRKSLHPLHRQSFRNCHKIFFSEKHRMLSTRDFFHDSPWKKGLALGKQLVFGKGWSGWGPLEPEGKLHRPYVRSVWARTVIQPVGNPPGSGAETPQGTELSPRPPPVLERIDAHRLARTAEVRVVLAPPRTRPPSPTVTRSPQAPRGLRASPALAHNAG